MSPASPDLEDAVALQRRLVDALRDPARFPHPVQAIRVIETHISFVILTGPYAYKIKKAVDLGFVDYSSLNRRRFFCDEEIRLNGRLAPHLYLGVEPIGGDAAAPRLGDATAPIEYAVKMREFDQDDLLDRMLQRNAVTAQHIDLLARIVADFHDAIATAAATDRHGDAAAIAAPMQENFAQLAAMPRLDDADDLQTVGRWSLSACRRLEPIFTARHAQGFVRECHGDLHLGNMALYESKVEVFDGIEFNDELRWIDVINEIAFLVMDLCERSRADFGWRFLNDYLELTGDYDGVALLTYYMTYRAVVRAKVARFRSLQDDVASDDRAAALAAYRGYLRYARYLTEQPPAAVLIMHGVSASGKSHLARLIGERLGAVRIRSDVERKRLLGLAPLGRSGSGLNSGIYDDEATERTYERLLQLARSVAAAGILVVIDAANLMRRQRQRFQNLAAELKLPFVIVACHAADGVLRQRLVARDLSRGDASEATLAVLRLQQQTAEAFSDEENVVAVSVDTDDEAASVAVIAELAHRLGR